jgi:hypothetical protein
MKKLFLFFMSRLLIGSAVFFEGAGGFLALAQDRPDASRTEQDRDLTGELRTGMIIEKIDGNLRNVDPFGLPMMPDKNVPVEDPGATEKEEPVEGPNGPALKEFAIRAAEKIPITGVYPDRQVLVVKGRLMDAGKSIVVWVENVDITLKFLGLNEDGIHFQDVDTGEVVVRQYKRLRGIHSRRKEEVPSRTNQKSGIFPRSQPIRVE